MKLTPTRREGRGWPHYMFWGRVRTSTAALLAAFIAVWWLYATYQPAATPEAPTNVVPPGYIPDPSYTWVPRTEVRERTTTPRTTTPTTTTTTTTTETTEPSTSPTSPTSTTSPTSPTTTTSTPPPLFEIPGVFTLPAPPPPAPAPTPAPGQGPMATPAAPTQ